jgi:hypothetical protein
MSEEPMERVDTLREKLIERGGASREREVQDRMRQLHDYAAALGTIRAARGVFLLILVLSLLAHIAAYSAVRWGDVLAPKETLELQLASPATDTATVAVADPETAATFSNWYYLIELLLPLAEFLGQVSCVLLTLSFLFAALVCLSGGLGGVRGSISAFFWILVLLALLFPWGRWLGDAPGVVQIPGIYYTFDELRQLPGEFRGQLHEVLHYVRYIGYPVLGLLIALTANSRFARGCRLVRRHLESRLDVKSI